MQKLFGDKEESVKGQPFLSEPLVRSESFQSDYALWKENGRRDTQLTLLKNAYHEVCDGDNSHPYLVRYISSQANGIAIYAGFGFRDEEYSYLLDYIKDKGLKMGYSVYSSDRKYFDKGETVEEKERHYLKPVPSLNDGEPMNQLYGNLMLELIVRNQKPFLLKVMASLYAGRQYREPLPFSTFADAIFE